MSSLPTKESGKKRLQAAPHTHCPQPSPSIVTSQPRQRLQVDRQQRPAELKTHTSEPNASLTLCWAVNQQQMNKTRFS